MRMLIAAVIGAIPAVLLGFVQFYPQAAARALPFVVVSAVAVVVSGLALAYQTRQA